MMTGRGSCRAPLSVGRTVNVVSGAPSSTFGRRLGRVGPVPGSDPVPPLVVLHQQGFLSLDPPSRKAPRGFGERPQGSLGIVR